MKRFLIAFALCMLSSFSVLAEDFSMTPYVGIEAGLKKTGIKNLEDGNKVGLNMFHGGAYAGIRVNEFIGAEVGGYMTPYKTKDVVAFRVKTKSFHATVLGFMPVMNNVELFGGVGLAHLNFKLKDLMQDVKVSFDRGIPRALLGAQYHFAENLTARAYLIYEHMPSAKFSGLQGVRTVGGNAGVFYNF